MYLRNAWYVAAWPRELTDKPLARVILDEPVVLFRGADGKPVALHDMCCHRQLPLSLGQVIGDRIRCGYHGYSFDGTGACVDIPGQPNIPAHARVRSFPVVEKWRCVWIWMGDAEADPAAIPNLWWLDHPEWKPSTPDMAPLKCDYRLIADNVLDATHLTYVHPTTIGASSIVEIEPRIENTDRTVRISRWMLDRPPPPAYGLAGDFGKDRADRWAAVEYWAPACCVNFAGCVDVGFGGEGADIRKSPRRVELVAISLPTPATSGSCYYFFAFARAFKHDDPEMDRFFGPGMVKVFEEDFVILESQQRMMEKYPDAKRTSTIYDRGPFLARRILDKMIEAEQVSDRAAE